ncbi:MAG: hypothetical protein ACRCWY_04360 [Cellulosilyticaceae bacterium]
MHREYDLYVVCGKCGCQKSKLDCERELMEAKRQYTPGCKCGCKMDCTTGEPYCTCGTLNQEALCKCKPCKEEEKECGHKPCHEEKTGCGHKPCQCKNKKETREDTYEKAETSQFRDIEIPLSEYEIRADFIV